MSEAQAEGLVDDIQHVGGDEAMATAKALVNDSTTAPPIFAVIVSLISALCSLPSMQAAREGLFSGTSGGGTLAVGLRIAKKSKPGTNIVVLIADTAER